MNRPTRLLLLLAALSFLPTLGFFMVGEEGIYTISTLEMWHSHDWLIESLYGQNLQRPPMFNWLTIPVAELVGWQHILLATRLVSVTATLGSAAVLYWLTQRLFGLPAFSLFASLCYLSLADLLLYRGWLSYTDPLFACFTFGAIATLWIAATEQRKLLLLTSILLLGCALLTKALTAYIFYATALFALLWQKPARRFLLSPVGLLTLSLSLVIPWLWFSQQPVSNSQQGASMLSEISRKLSAEDGWHYLQRLITYPFENLLWLLPAPVIALYLLLRKRRLESESKLEQFRTSLLITGLSILPYWLAPQGGIRYLLPIYPLIALISARLIWRGGESAQILALRWISGVIALKFIFALLLFPYYQSHYRGENYVTIGRALHTQTQGYPLYASDVRSLGENIIGQIDIERLPQAPLQTPPAIWTNGFHLSASADDGGSQVLLKIEVARDVIYLLCRGEACGAKIRLPPD